MAFQARRSSRLAALVLSFEAWNRLEPLDLHARAAGDSFIGASCSLIPACFRAAVTGRLGICPSVLLEASRSFAPGETSAPRKELVGPSLALRARARCARVRSKPSRLKAPVARPASNFGIEVPALAPDPTRRLVWIVEEAHP